jgi:hypothetical protein
MRPRLDEQKDNRHRYFFRSIQNNSVRLQLRTAHKMISDYFIEPLIYLSCAAAAISNIYFLYIRNSNLRSQRY